MIVDGADLNECEDLSVNAFRQTHETVAAHLHIGLHKPVIAARTELGGTQIVLSDDLILFKRRIGDHDDPLALFEFSFVIADDLSDAFVDQRHRELFLQHFRVALPLVVPLVGVADGQVDRTDDHVLGLLFVDFLLHSDDFLWFDQSIYSILHVFLQVLLFA